MQLISSAEHCDYDGDWSSSRVASMFLSASHIWTVCSRLKLKNNRVMQRISHNSKYEVNCIFKRIDDPTKSHRLKRKI